MAKIEMTLEGNLQTRSINEKGVELVTDCPLEFQGNGKAFSPTDLLCVALASCILTVMGIKARNIGVDVTGLRASIEKEMAKIGLRRVARIAIDIYVPSHISEEALEKLKKAASTCPVYESLHPEIEKEIRYHL